MVEEEEEGERGNGGDLQIYDLAFFVFHGEWCLRVGEVRCLED